MNDARLDALERVAKRCAENPMLAMNVNFRHDDILWLVPLARKGLAAESQAVCLHSIICPYTDKDGEIRARCAKCDQKFVATQWERSE